MCIFRFICIYKSIPLYTYLNFKFWLSQEAAWRLGPWEVAIVGAEVQDGGGVEGEGRTRSCMPTCPSSRAPSKVCIVCCACVLVYG